ncbi:serine hydrolase domain-containing protein [Thermopolyspora sp. NPDC052614]|uniref:serine hydrolase domain-containing protein n=1 Tax=Thermopolyspora sp. NPDC052614 TaxID=3155682 RepID=UPI003426B6FA
MAGALDPRRWRTRLAELIEKYEVPGASLAIEHDGEVYTFTAGVLNVDTGAPVQPDSLFQIGSITKVYTTTQIMQLVEQGRLTLDTRVIEVLPEFKVADPDATENVTIRHLLTHTSGLDGDLFLDTGRGDDCVAKYVEACADLAQNHPVGATHSYCNSGFIILGRVVEKLTGKVWDAALREQVIEPLGLTHTWTLPEEVLRFGAAVGHLDGKVAPVWHLMRSCGPAGTICARPSDVVAFARAHLTPGRLLAHPEAMREPQVEVPNPQLLGTHWGLGWILDEWDGHPVFSHGGNTIGQASELWVVDDTIACVVANGGQTMAFQQTIAEEVFGELLGARPPADLVPPQTPVEADLSRYAGVYERASTRMTLTVGDGVLDTLVEVTGTLAGLEPPMRFELIPTSATTFVGRPEGQPRWLQAVFYELADGSPYVHFGGRATPKRT